MKADHSTRSVVLFAPCILAVILAGCAKQETLPAAQSEDRPAVQPARQTTEAAEATGVQEPSGEGSEWPGFRGPHGNGFSPEVPRRLPRKTLLWSRPMSGECHAPISVGGGYVVVADHGDGRDYWRAFDAADGAPAWTYPYPNAERMEFGAAPRTAPRIYRDRVYCMSAWGELFCLELSTGNLVWKKHLAREFQQKTPTWGYTCSPLVADGKLIVNPGGRAGPVAALDPATGSVVWTGEGEGINYATFLAGTFGGVEQVVGYDDKTAGGWDVQTGRRLWTLEVENSYGYIVPSPVAVDGKLLLTSEQENARLIEFAASGVISDEPAAESEDLAPEIATPTVWGGVILGASAGLVLLDPASPGPGARLKTLWIYDAEDSVTGLCHVIASADRALVMGEDGELLLLALDREAPRILDRQKLCDRTLVHPALAAGRFYVRDDAKLYCYDLRPGEGP